jgi:hypothetical protein
VTERHLLLFVVSDFCTLDGVILYVSNRAWHCLITSFPTRRTTRWAENDQ